MVSPRPGGYFAFVRLQIGIHPAQWSANHYGERVEKRNRRRLIHLRLAFQPYTRLLLQNSIFRRETGRYNDTQTISSVSYVTKRIFDFVTAKKYRAVRLLYPFLGSVSDVTLIIKNYFN